MASVKPFKIVRPARDKANLIVSRPYHIYSEEELRARLDYNPYSFLHILNPGYKFEKEISGEKRFKLVRNRYQEFKDNGVYKQEDTPAYMLYQMNMPEYVFTGIIAATSVQDYQNNCIKRHEETIEQKEQLFKNYLKTVGFIAEPVLLTHPDNSKLDALFSEIMKDRPEYEFTTTDRICHKLWMINDEVNMQRIQTEFSQMENLYIADGHHRSASSALLAADFNQEDTFEVGKTQHDFMSYIIPESNLKIYEFYRLITDLNGLSKNELLMQLDEFFRIENLGYKFYKPTTKHSFSMYLDGDFYELHLRKAAYNFTNILEELDAQILYERVLKPIFGIEDLRNDKRIDYLPGIKDAYELKVKVDSGKYKVAFGMTPVDVSTLKKIADEGFKMPPKSTYIRPKLRSGLAIYEF